MVGTLSAIDAQADMFTVPEGVQIFTLPHGATSYLSFPLTADPVYSDAVSAVTTNTISVANTSAFTGTLATLTEPTSSIPYFVKFLTGAQTGRVMLVTGNTASSLTLDTTDHTATSPESLTGNTDSISSITPTPFNVAVGDTFEVFPGDTLATLFGDNVVGGDSKIKYPLMVTGGTNVAIADTIALPTISTAPQTTYFFNTTYGYWVQYGGPLSGGVPVNANKSIIYPYSALTAFVRNTHPDVSLALTGRVAEVPLLIKTIGNTTKYTSTQYPVDVTLSQLQLGSNWTKGTNVVNSDVIGVWNGSAIPGHFDSYYQLSSNSQWRKYPNGSTDVSSFVIPAGSTITIAKRGSVSGAASYLQPAMTYTLP